MVSLRYASTNVGHGDSIPEHRHGLRPSMDGEQKAIQTTEHTSRIQRLPGFPVILYVL